MEKNKKVAEQARIAIGDDFVNHFWEKSWTYIKTVVDVVREPVLILDKNFRVMAANESFYRVFQVDPKDTEQQIVYALGNGQWDIPALRKLLEDILPKNTFFKGFEVAHDFPSIGHKTMILNARQIHVKEDAAFPPIILLAIEDVTEIMGVAEMLAHHTKQFEIKTGERIEKLEVYIKRLEEMVGGLKNRTQSS
ncbi:MAG: PAS domain-containing protein [Patescibacteria group bacterium]|nr:PAS domain-containing protein [Patescibacteria group bacterium]